MKLSLEALQLLDAIELRGSFAAAAAALHRVPSAVTHAIRKLEEELGAHLFQKEGRRAVLTPAGRILLEEGRRLLREAEALERRVQRMAKGWEAELRIAVDNVIDFATLIPLIQAFDQEDSGTRLRFCHEVLGGTWDALLSGRADLAIAAQGDPPASSGIGVHLWGEMQFVLAVAPHHPLATAPDPIPPDVLAQHRVVAIADSSRTMEARSMGLPTGQTTITVPSLSAKALAQMAGLGIGHLPLDLARREADAGRLVIKQEQDNPLSRCRLYLAWRTKAPGKALIWFRDQLSSEAWRQRLLPP